MAATLVLVAVTAAGAVFIVLFARGLVLLRTEPEVPRYMRRVRRRKTPLPTKQAGPFNNLLEGVGRPFRNLLGGILGTERLERTRRRIGAAGMSNVVTTDLYLSRRAGAIVLFTVFGLLTIWLGQYFLGFIGILFGQVWTDGHLWLLARKRASEIDRELPDFLDVLAVTVSAGLGFRRALERVIETKTGALAEEFNVALHQMDLGTPRRDAFRQLRARNNSPTLNQFLTAVLQAEELGAPLADALVEIATDMRQNTRQQARRRAARAAPRMQLVIVFFLVPGALILFLGSLLVTIFSGGVHVFS